MEDLAEVQGVWAIVDLDRSTFKVRSLRSKRNETHDQQSRYVNDHARDGG